jgi:hypothetical protein
VLIGQSEGTEGKICVVTLGGKRRVPIVAVQSTPVLDNKKLFNAQRVTPARSQEILVDLENTESLKGVTS